ncbi:hypothetical protein BSF_19900 [Bacillus subtilis]|nr:hypothetical protein BSF_19900 [Bacillus subtilis]
MFLNRKKKVKTFLGKSLNKTTILREGRLAINMNVKNAAAIFSIAIPII